MAGTAAGAGSNSRKRRRGRAGAGSLTPELIVKESLRLLDENGLDGIQPAEARPRSSARIRPLSTGTSPARDDPGARHRGPSLIEDAMAGLTPQACWIDHHDGSRAASSAHLL